MNLSKPPSDSKSRKSGVAPEFQFQTRSRINLSGILKDLKLDRNMPIFPLSFFKHQSFEKCRQFKFSTRFPSLLATYPLPIEILKDLSLREAFLEEEFGYDQLLLNLNHLQRLKNSVKSPSTTSQSFTTSEGLRMFPSCSSLKVFNTKVDIQIPYDS